MALLAADGPERAVLVVFDGVSNTDRLRRRLAGRRAAAREVLRTPLPAGMGTPESRVAAVTKVFTDAAAAANDGDRRASPTGRTQPRRRRRSSPPCSRALVPATPTSATPAATGCPTTASGPRSPSTTRSPRRRSRRACRAPRPRRSAGPRDHQVARPGRARPRPAGRAASTSTGPAGCSCAPTGCGTTPPSRARSSRRSRRPADRPAAIAPPLVAFANARRPGQHHRRAGPGGPSTRAAALARSTSEPSLAGHRDVRAVQTRTDADDCTRRRESRWLSSPPPSTRTSSCPTAAPTSTRSSRSTCTGAGTAGQTGSGAAGEIIIVDTSGSMGPATMAAAKQAAQAALAEIVDGTWFAVIAGSDRAMLAYPQVNAGPALVQMNAATRAEAVRRDRAASSAAAVRRSAPGSTSPASSSRRCPR